MRDKSSCLKFINIPVAFPASLDGIELDFGPAATGWVLRLLCDCASAQARDPYYFLPITTERDYRALASRAHIPDSDTCRRLIEALDEEGFIRVAKVGDKSLFSFQMILEDEARLRMRTEQLSRAGKKGAKARWQNDADAKDG